MTPGLWIGLGIFLAGLVLRLWARRPFVDAHVARHAAPPPRNWPWTPSGDPVIERLRRRTLLGTALLWIGAIVAVLSSSPVR